MSLYCIHPECKAETLDELRYMAEQLRGQRFPETASALDHAGVVLTHNPKLQVRCRHVPRETRHGPFPPVPLP